MLYKLRFLLIVKVFVIVKEATSNISNRNKSKLARLYIYIYIAIDYSLLLA